MCGGETVTLTLHESVTPMRAAETMLRTVRAEIETALAAGERVKLQLVKCDGTGQWQIIMDQCDCRPAIQLPLPLLMEV